MSNSDDVRRNLAKRKRTDALFAVLGAVLIFLSLGTLAVLIGDLTVDGMQRITSTTLLKQDGSTPARREVIGKVARQGDHWVLERDRMRLDTREVTEPPLDPLDGKRVILTGTLGGPDEAMEVGEVKPAPAAAEEQPRLGRRDIVGVLKKDPKAEDKANPWTLAPDALRLSAEGMSHNFDQYQDGWVAVAGTRSADGTMTVDGIERLHSRSFFRSMPSSRADRAGIYSAWVGTLVVVLVTVCTALPLGVAAGVYLEEYARKNWITALIEINIANLAGVPSIIWGLMALGLFIYQLGTGRSILTAGLTLGLLVLPIVIISTREAIRAVPTGIRDASIALGATKWETVRHHVLPYSMGGILTGTIVSLSRAIGETAPLVTIGAATYVPFLPDSPIKDTFPFLSFSWLQSSFTVLPIQMFNWVSTPDPAFHKNAAAAGVVLIFMTLSLNAVAIYLRFRLRRSIKW